MEVRSMVISVPTGKSLFLLRAQPVAIAIAIKNTAAIAIARAADLFKRPYVASDLSI
jgi:hypothetical protein